MTKELPLTIRGVLETSLYAEDLVPAAEFYEQILGLHPFAREVGRHVFFRSGEGVFLLFNPAKTSVSSGEVPPHGARGPGHVAFRVGEAELESWKSRLERLDVVVEAEVEWPRGGSSIYLRDPAGNSVELATGSIWGLAESAGSHHPAPSH